jgi:hypothetical protein
VNKVQARLVCQAVVRAKTPAGGSNPPTTQNCFSTLRPGQPPSGNGTNVLCAPSYVELLS